MFKICLKVIRSISSQGLKEEKVNTIQPPSYVFLTFNDKFEKRNKSVAFRMDVEDDEEQVKKDTNDSLTEFIALLQFFLKKS